MLYNANKVLFMFLQLQWAENTVEIFCLSVPCPLILKSFLPTGTRSLLSVQRLSRRYCNRITVMITISHHIPTLMPGPMSIHMHFPTNLCLFYYWVILFALWWGLVVPFLILYLFSQLVHARCNVVTKLTVSNTCFRQRNFLHLYLS